MATARLLSQFTPVTNLYALVTEARCPGLYPTEWPPVGCPKTISTLKFLWGTSQVPFLVEKLTANTIMTIEGNLEVAEMIHYLTGCDNQ